MDETNSLIQGLMPQTTANTVLAPQPVEAPLATPVQPEALGPSTAPLDEFEAAAQEGARLRAEQEAQARAAEMQNLLGERQALMEQMKADAAAGIGIEGLRAKYGPRMSEIDSLTANFTPPAPAPAPQQQPVSVPEDRELAIAETIADQAEAASLQDIEAAAQPIRQQNAQVQAAAIEQQKAQDVATQQAVQAQETVDREYTSMQDLWNRGSNGEKTRVAIGLILGALGQGISGEKENAVYKMLDNQFKQNVEAKKLRGEQAKAAMEAQWKLVELQLKEAQTRTSIQLDQARITEIKSKLQMEQQKYRDEQLKLRALNSGSVLDPSLLTLEQQEVAVRLPDGSYRLAKVGGKEAVKQLNKYRAETEPAIEGIERIKEFAKNGSKLDPKTRAKVASELIALTGQLKTPLTGEGAMREEEYQRILEALGNPNDLSDILNLAQVRLNTVQNKLRNDLRKRFYMLGIDVPMNQRDVANAARERLAKQGYSEKSISAILKARGLE